MTATPRGLARKSLGTAGLCFLGVSASSPMTVLAGAIVAIYGATGVIGVPLSFIVLMAALLLFAVGFVTMSRDVAHTATFYAFLAHGLGRVWGVAGAGVALVAYNAIQISLYGLFGATAAGFLGGPWWMWALAVWIVIGLLGVLHIELNTQVLAVVLIVELAVIVLFDLAAFGQPAGGTVSIEPLLPGSLFVDGVGGVLAFGIAAFIGFESIPVYREEAREYRSIRRAAFGTLVFLGLFYAVSSWAMAVVVGPDNVVAAARDPDSGLPFSVLDAQYGSLIAGLGLALLVLSVFAALLSFHNVVARYVYGLAREGVLPGALEFTGGTSGGVPIAGSLVQSITGLGTICLFAAIGADPIAAMFIWLSTLAALGVLLLMIGGSTAVIGFYRTRHGQVPRWQRLIAPAAGGVTLTIILLITVANLGSLLGEASASSLQWLLPTIIILAAAGGAAWGLHLRYDQPGVYAAIGRGQPKPLAVLDRVLSKLEL